MSTSSKGLSCNGEIDLIVKWFTEFSEMQKSDFFKILLNKYAGSKVNSNLVTLLLKDIEFSDQPPTIFKCRIKLFDEWFSNWSDEQKEILQRRLTTVDEDFMVAFKHVLDCDSLDEDLLQQPIINLQGIIGKVVNNGSQNGSDSIPSLDSLVTKKSDNEEEQITTEI